MHYDNKIKSLTTLEFIDYCSDSSAVGSIPSVFAFELKNIEMLNIFKKGFEQIERFSPEVYFSDSVTSNWVESKFSNFDMFSGNTPLIIYNCEKIPKELLEEIRYRANDIGIVVTLFFNNDIQKKWKGGGIKVKSPGSWEGGKLLNSLFKFYGIRINIKAKVKAEKFVETNGEYTFKLVESLRSFNNIEVTETHLAALLPKNSVNNFELANLLNQKMLREFFSKLLMSSNFEELSLLLSFSISHLIKVVGPFGQEMNKNKYTRGIVSASKRYNEKELSMLIGTLKNIMVLARTKNKKAFIELMKASLLFK